MYFYLLLVPAIRLQVTLLRGPSWCFEGQSFLHPKGSSYSSRSKQVPKDWTEGQGTINYQRILKWNCIFSSLTYLTALTG